MLVSSTQIEVVFDLKNRNCEKSSKKKIEIVRKVESHLKFFLPRLKTQYLNYERTYPSKPNFVSTLIRYKYIGF